MTTPTTATPQQRGTGHQGPRWWQRPWILPLTLFSVAFLVFAVPPYLGLDPAQARLPAPESLAWHYPVLVTHIFGGALLTLLVILQVWPWLRSRYPAMHRWSGRVYVFAGIPLVGVPALLISPVSSSGFSTQVSNTLWAVLWLSFTVLGYAMARRRRFADHRAWMLRSFALLYGIALNRVVIVVMLLVSLPRLEASYGGDEAALTEAIAPASSFLSWVLPLLFVEWWLQYRRPRRRRTGAATS
ncbi:hypothetical protein A6A08_26085 [Nocardiopsis sp. TSRI0078]|uniref:DUF2306 domain-containing protein n=1 Tax=unclassified Nocardiopsis TaxID=2649073 RepID=UPI00093D5844|nr:DUF2306 domain-containing protein [Nocardiopsis sp. TSRI0078]OKI17338.1 hypothetical protein A6A08_26085 [Nocardiopsis sp. TSRI0078]